MCSVAVIKECGKNKGGKLAPFYFCLKNGYIDVYVYKTDIYESDIYSHKFRTQGYKVANIVFPSSDAKSGFNMTMSISASRAHAGIYTDVPAQSEYYEYDGAHLEITSGNIGNWIDDYTRSVPIQGTLLMRSQSLTIKR